MNIQRNAHNFLNKEDSQKNPEDHFCPNDSKEHVEQLRHALSAVYAKISVSVIPEIYISDGMGWFAYFFMYFSCRKQRKITKICLKNTKIWQHKIVFKAGKHRQKVLILGRKTNYMSRK